MSAFGIFLLRQRLRSVSLLFVVENRTQWDVLMAGSVVASLSMIIVFLIFQRRFIRGIAVSGLKG